MPPSIEEPRATTRHWWTLVVRDVQFWIPVAVLCGGLLVLGWIA
jgi:hypothetical protein